MSGLGAVTSPPAAPRVEPSSLEDVLAPCAYAPTYVVKDFPIARYQGLQFVSAPPPRPRLPEAWPSSPACALCAPQVYLSFVYPNDHTRLTHMETDNKCFYRESPLYLERFGFYKYMKMDREEPGEEDEQVQRRAFLFLNPDGECPPRPAPPRWRRAGVRLKPALRRLPGGRGGWGAAQQPGAHGGGPDAEQPPTPQPGSPHKGSNYPRPARASQRRTGAHLPALPGAQLGPPGGTPAAPSPRPPPAPPPRSRAAAPKGLRDSGAAGPSGASSGPAAPERRRRALAAVPRHLPAPQTPAQGAAAGAPSPAPVSRP